MSDTAHLQCLSGHPRRILRAESGFVVPLIVIVLFVIAILAGASITVAVQASKSSSRDASVKTALAAAEAGLQIAAYRLDELKPTASECINGFEHVNPAVKKCESTAESLGNGATFTYWTTLPVSTGELCAGTTVTVASNETLRCITAEGKVSGLSKNVRLQTLMAATMGENLFTVHGILGLSEVLVSGSVKATAVVASNEKVKGEGSAAFEKGFELCPGGTFSPAAGKERNKSGVTVHGVGGEKTAPEYEKTRSAAECPIVAKIPASHATAAENNDIRISTGEDPATKEGWNNPEYTGPSKYELTLGSGAELTMKGSKYYFCNFKATNNGILKIGTGVKAEIFVDDHAENSNCPTTAGAFKIEGNAHMENPNGATAVLIEVAGPGPVVIANSGSLKANIYAPEAEVELSGAGTLTGAIVGKKVHLTAGSFVFSEEDESFTVSGSSTIGYSRKAWEPCTTATGTAAGC